MVSRLGKSVAAAFAAFFLQTAASAQTYRIPEGKPWEPNNLSIDWFVENATEAFARAIEDRRAVVMLFNSEFCSFCDRLIERFNCPALARHADTLHFAYSTNRGDNGFSDPGARDLKDALKVDAYPTLLVVLPSANEMTVVGALRGEFSAPEVDRLLLKVYASDRYKKTYGGAPNLATVDETKKLLDKRGISRPSEAFCSMS